MWMAYWDRGELQVKDIPLEETRVPLFPLESLSHAQSTLAQAKLARPDIEWGIKEDRGAYSVREKGH